MSEQSHKHKDELEQYLQQQAGKHRMYPSDAVWKNVNKKIHTPKKWPALSVFTVLTITALVIGTVLNKPVPDTVTANFHFTLQSSANIETEKHNAQISTAQQEPLNDEHFSPEKLTTNTVIEVTEKAKIDNAVALQLMQHDNIALMQYQQPSTNNVVATINVATLTPDKNSSTKNIQSHIVKNNNDKTELSFTNIDSYLFDVSSRLKSILNTPSTQSKSGGVAFFLPKNNNINYDGFEMYIKPTHVETIPLALEQLGKKSSRFDFRFYLTPSISYRRLDEKAQKSTQVNTITQSNYNVKPSQAINQRPAIGYETGLGLGYALSNKFTLTGGFQFNISQYKIDAFLYKDEPALVTLGEGKFLNNINTVSSLRSIPGTTPLTIKNRYYQISMPLGIDWMAWNNSRFSFGLAGGLQPTYTFDKQPLIMTANFKNYADGSNYVRNWNVNANLESYFGYTTGSYRWQIGPQLRYQLLPSLVDKYPNKEYLFNYGLKIGVVKHLK